MGMTDVRPDRPVTDHAAHDRLLIARAASDDELTPTEQATVAERLATCPDCAALHADLLAMAAGLRSDLPLPRRPRDFRLSADALVRGPSWRERLSRGLVGPAVRPLAAAVCALGLLLAVTGTVLPRAASTGTLSNVGSAVTGAGAPVAAPDLQGAGAAGATPAPTAGDNRSTEGGGPGPSAVGVAPGSPQPRSTLPPGAFGQPPSGGAADLTGGGVPPTASKNASAPGPDPGTLLIGAGLLLFVAGGGAFLVLKRRPT